MGNANQLKKRKSSEHFKSHVKILQNAINSNFMKKPYRPSLEFLCFVLLAFMFENIAFVGLEASAQKVKLQLTNQCAFPHRIAGHHNVFRPDKILGSPPNVKRY